jgi:Kef-type K+ transport system membrane component KefB
MAILDRSNVRLLFPLLLAFVMAWLANMVQLAPIVGAFAAGLVLNESQFAAYKEDLSVQDWIRPLESVFSPIFFVLMGMQVNLEAFMRPQALMLGAALLLAATVGKLIAGIAAGRSADRLSVGVGMVPRGEVGLIFASVGRGLGVVGDVAFSAIVMMVIVTTLIAPPALRWSLYRRSGPVSV